jgi:predicted signal transduction protein with EAL and GGDEF domain
MRLYLGAQRTSSSRVDFGQGFGACYYLKHLTFDYLKIDGDFVRGFGTDTTDCLVVEAIVGIAKAWASKRWPNSRVILRSAVSL